MFRQVCLCLTLAASFRAWSAEPAKKEKPAKLSISGCGLLVNREIKRTIRTLELSGKKPPFFDASFVEDAALIVSARLRRDGYLEPSIAAHLRLDNGKQIDSISGDLIENPLPRDLRIVEVRFKVRRGRLFHFQELEFVGLESIPEKEARSYFIETDALFHPKSARVFTPERLRRGVSSLADLLDRQGYREAKVEVAHELRDERTGEVKVQVRVEQGPKFLVHSVREEFFYARAQEPERTNTVFPNKPYSRFWEQDFVQGLKTNEFHQGYPDTTVELRTLQRAPKDKQIAVDLLATIKAGSQVRIDGVEFKGEKKTKKWLMSRRVRVKRGELLDPTRTEEGRYRLARLGGFDTVELEYEPVDETHREVIYRVKEGKTVNVSLLFGYGSYELLRAGVEAEQENIWGLAHHARIKVVQSFKASSGDFNYTVPDLIGEDVDVFVQGSALRREEVSFLREEYGGGIGLHKYFKPYATDLSVRYSYQILNALDTFPAIATEGLTNPAVGSIIIDAKYDRRDNPLYPRKGIKWFTTVESASDSLGGEANYERVETSASWYHGLGGGRYLSLGVSHGAAVSFGDPANNLPFNKRFFPGGSDSIRGYQEGEATPRNAQGSNLGAETYSLGSVEFEQALTRKWSVVVFSDSLGFAEHMTHYPFDTGLFSVGGGIRWRSIIGPVRLEYGHNLNPRKFDPQGTLQFSLGFPF
jgi:outer membrane protein assembly complex protein YaeT